MHINSEQPVVPVSAPVVPAGGSTGRVTGSTTESGSTNTKGTTRSQNYMHGVYSNYAQVNMKLYGPLPQII